MWRMNVSASIQNSSSSPSITPLGAGDVALRSAVFCLGGREGGEVVAPEQRVRRTASSASRSSAPVHQKARLRSNTLRVRRASTR